MADEKKKTKKVTTELPSKSRGGRGGVKGKANAKPITKRKAEDGRPRLEFNLKEVEALGAIQCTYDEMAAVLCCSADTITRRMKEEPSFAEAYKKGVEGGKVSLKRKQFTLATGGNVTMLIWLGKQHLGQTDKIVQKNINAGSLALLTHLSPKERLEALKRGLDNNSNIGAEANNGGAGATDTANSK
jgi:hypothetical protein